MKYRQIFLIVFLCACIFSACLKDENIKLPFDVNNPESYYTPAQLGDGWDISTPEKEGLNREDINKVYQKFYSLDLNPTIHSLLIIRNGKIVAEAYCRDKNERDRFHNIQSVTKSITSLLTGITIDKGLIESVDQTVYHFIPEYFDSAVRKQEITIHHVLTMETGLDFDNDKHTLELFNDGGSSLKYVLHKKLIFIPGTSWYYGDGNPQLLSGIIQRVTGKTEEQFARENLFGPLGIKNYQWEKHADGLTYGAFGLWLIPRDMAKIGLLMARDGMWNDNRIVSSQWITASTKQQTTRQNYGYYWYPMQAHKGFYAEGHGGQLIYVIPDKQLVVVITADSYSDVKELSSRFYDLFFDIFNAVVE